jgi:hypothetical protein
MPQVDAAALLEDVSGVIQEQYFPEFTEETPALHGKTTNKLFKPMMEEITGDGKTLQVEIRRPDSVRPMSNALADFENPDVFEEETIKVRFNKKTTANSDFTRISGSCQTNLIDVKEAGKGSIIDLVERMVRQIVPDWEHKVAMLRHAPSTGRIAIVNGTPRENDHWEFDSTTATADNTDGIRFQVDNGSSANFYEGLYVDFWDPTNLNYSAQNIRIEGKINTSDSETTSGVGTPSIGGAFITSGRNRLSSGDLANVADNDEIYMAGAKDEGMYSFGAYFGRPASDGTDSFIGGKDRADTDNQWLLPLTLREGASANVQVAKTHFNQLARAMAWEEDEVRDSMVTMMALDLHDTLRDAVGEDSFINIPTNDSRLERFANFGSVGLNYQHPTLGIIKLLGDPMALENTIRFFQPDTWKTLYYGWRGLEAVQGGDIGDWYRMSADATGAGKGAILKKDFWSLCMDFCFSPWMNAQINNVTA